MKAANEKLVILKKRKWQKLSDGTYQHIKKPVMSKWKNKPPTQKQSELLDFMLRNSIDEISPKPLSILSKLKIYQVESRLKGLQLRGYIERLPNSTMVIVTTKAKDYFKEFNKK